MADTEAASFLRRLVVMISAAIDGIAVMVVLGLVGLAWQMAFVAGVAVALVSLFVMARLLHVRLIGG
jgi:uncharacterized membrane protein